MLSRLHVALMYRYAAASSLQLPVIRVLVLFDNSMYETQVDVSPKSSAVLQVK